MSDTAHIADNVLSLLHHVHAPAADCVAPFLPRLFAALADGHTFIYLNKEETAQLARAQPIVGADAQSPLVLYRNRLFLAKFWQLEHHLAREIHRLSHYRRLPERWDFIQQQLQAWFADSGSQDQQAAAALTLLHNFMLISGGPGTGKTTTVAKLLALLCHDTLPRIALAAPTGKAAARMSEALKNAVTRIDGLPESTAAHLRQLNGQTVHRLLALTPPQMLPEYNADNRLPLDILIVDEASMLDLYLLHQLLQALPTSCRVILLGDENQLPSVSAGAVLSALMQSSTALPEPMMRELRQLLPSIQLRHLRQGTAKLTISHRFGAESGIGCLARAVVSGEAEQAWQQFTQFPQVLSHHQHDIAHIAQQLYRAHQAYWQAIDDKHLDRAFAHQADVLVLSAQRADAHALNQAYLQQLHQHHRAHPDQPWFKGQMLIITRNDPSTQLYNGDVGIVLPHEYGLAAWFPDTAHRFRPIALSRLPEHENAFTLTVHKSQGSEYREIWFLPPTQRQDDDFSRALLYTAITRAKEKFVYCGNKSSFQKACNTPDKRRSALNEWLTQIQGDLFV